MDFKKEIIDAIQIMVESAIKKSCPSITFGVVTAIGSNNKCTILLNNISYTLNYYGSGVPIINQKYPVFVTGANFSKAFVLTGIGDTNQIYDKTLNSTQQEINDSLLIPQSIDIDDYFTTNPFDVNDTIEIYQVGKIVFGYIEFRALSEDFTNNGAIANDYVPITNTIITSIYDLTNSLPVGSFVINNTAIMINNGTAGGYISFSYMIA